VQGEGTLEPRSGWFVGVGLALIGAFIAVLLILMATTGYDTWGAMFVAPLLVAVSLPVLARQAKREEDRWLFMLLVVALLLKLGGAIARHYVAFDVYGGVADANLYDQEGRKLAEQFIQGNFDHGYGELSSVEFMQLLTGIIYTFIGPSRLGGFLVYSWLGFWGLFFFYRAFSLSVPEGRKLTYARLLFFLPSLLFWPSSIGKESWMMFALGIAAFGVARVLTRTTLWGAGLAALGLWLAALPRPHIAGLMAVGLAGAYLIRRPKAELRELAPVVKGLGVLLVGVLALIVVVKANHFLKEQGVDTDRGLTSALTDVTSRTSRGGSSFVPSILESPVRAPIAVATVLFRPFPFEAHNFQALAASFETTFLLLLSLARFRWVIAALRSVRRQPYVAFAIIYTALFIVAFSSFGNFGLLARERVQLFPVYLLLLAVPPPEKRKDVGPAAETDAQLSLSPGRRGP
jgi:hypothetical protein